MTVPADAAAAFPTGRSVTVAVPASSANLGPGFDSVGLALDLTDTVRAALTGDDVRIIVEGEGSGVVPTDRSHLVWQAAEVMWRALDLPQPDGVELICRNTIPHARGLGSSAAAIVAGLAVGLSLAGGDLTDPAALQTVANLAADLEGHPDNASASVYGGMTLSWADDGGSAWHTVAPAVHESIRLAVLVPRAELSTESARAALGESVSLSAAASTAGRSALLLHAMTQRPDLLLPATRDWLHQDARRAAYEPSMALVDTLRARGIAAAISGAGPAVIALAAGEVEVTADELPEGWELLRPQVARSGVRVVSRSEPQTV